MKKLRVTVDGKAYQVLVEFLDDEAKEKAAADVPDRGGDRRDADRRETGDQVLSPLAATVIQVHFLPGDRAEEGATLFTLEAMKMNTHVSADRSGVVGEVLVKPGDSVEEGQALMEWKS